MQVCAHGLYAEQLSGSPFTAPRKDNLRSWLYRTRPSVGHEPFERLQHPGSPDLLHATDTNSEVTPNQLRWLPAEAPSTAVDFVQSLSPICGAGRSVDYCYSHPIADPDASCCKHMVSVHLTTIGGFG